MRDISKLAGSAALVAAALIFYFDTRALERRREDQIKAYILLVEHIKKQIECFLLPIDRILWSCDEELLRRCGVSEGARVSDLNALLSGARLCLCNEALGVMRSFADNFGTYYSRAQIESCEYCIRDLMAIEKRMHEESKKNGRIRLTLCLCISLSLILMLI